MPALNLFFSVIMSAVASIIPHEYFKIFVSLFTPPSFGSAPICQCVLQKYSFQKYFLRAYYVPSIVLCTWNT